MIRAIIKFLAGILVIIFMVWLITITGPLAADAMTKLVNRISAAIPDISYTLPPDLVETPVPEPTTVYVPVPVVPQPEPPVVNDIPTPAPGVTSTPDPTNTSTPAPTPTPTVNPQWICPIVGVGGC